MSKNLILDKLEGVKGRFEEVAGCLQSLMWWWYEKIHQLNKEYKELKSGCPPISNIKTHWTYWFNKDILRLEKDEEMREMAKTDWMS